MLLIDVICNISLIIFFNIIWFLDVMVLTQQSSGLGLFLYPHIKFVLKILSIESVFIISRITYLTLKVYVALFIVTGCFAPY